MDRKQDDAAAGHATGVSTLIERIQKRDAVVSIVGLGYVGLPLAHAFHAAGFPVVGFDIDTQKVNQIAAGQSYMRHFDHEKVRELSRSERFSGTTDFSRIREADAVLICVPTPLDVHHEPDLSYVEGTARAIAPYLRANQLIVLESTTYPGTTDELLRGVLNEGSGLSAGSDYFLAYSPEREDPGNPNFDAARIPKVVGADDESAAAVAVALYGAVVPSVVPVSSSRTAEAVKLLENIFRSVNIALVNELKLVFEKMNIDVFEVIEAASTKPFGFMPFYPGPGLGGHCIPIDPFYLTWKAREYGVHSSFIELAGQVNTRMPAHVVHRTMEALNHQGKALRNARVLCLGLAYKPDVDDTRESPAFAIMDHLASYGANVDYYDPYVPVVPHTREHAAWEGRKSVGFDQETIGSYDAVVIVTNHRVVNYEELGAWAQCIVDSRGVMRGVQTNGTPVWAA